MPMEILSKLITGIAGAIPVLFFLSLVIRYFRRRDRERDLPTAIEDAEALARAEAEVRRGDPRKELYLNNYTLLENFSTVQGYTASYMDQLVGFLEAREIPAASLFQESLPAGVLAVSGGSGTYELYVQRGLEAAARAAVRDFRSLPERPL